MRHLRSILSAALLAVAAALASAPADAQTFLGTVGTGASPQAVVVNPLNNKTYIAQHGAGTVRVINGATGEFADVDVSFRGNPRVLAINPIDRRVMVATDHGFVVIDGNTDSVVANSDLAYANPDLTAIAFNVGDDNLAYLLDTPNNTVWECQDVGCQTEMAINFSLVIPCPTAVAANPITGSAYITNPCTNQVAAHTTAFPFGSYIDTGPGTAPAAVAVNPVTNTIYVALSAGNGVAVIDGASNTLTTTIPTGSAAPTAIAVNPATNRIYVAYGDGTVTVINAAAANATTSIPVGTNPVGITIDNVRNQVYVANQTDGTVTAIDGASNVATTITVAPGPTSIAVNPLTSRVSVVSSSGNSLTTIDGRTYTHGSIAAANAVATAVNPLTRRAFVATGGNPGAVKVINQNDDSVLATIAVGGDPNHIAVDPGLRRIYTSNSTSGNVSVIDGNTNAVITAVPVETFPGAIAVNPVTHKVYVAQPGTGHVSVIDGTNLGAGSIVVSVGGVPVALAVNAVTNTVYVGDSGTNPVIDGATNAVTTLTNSVFVVSAASDIAVNTATNRVYIARPLAGKVEEFDGATRDLLSTPTSYTVANPLSIAVNSVTDRVYVANGASALSVIDAGVVGTSIPLAEASEFVAVDEVSDRVYVTGTSRLFTIDGETATVSRTVSPVAVANPPGLAAVDPSSGKAYAPVPGGTQAIAVKEATPLVARHGVGGVIMAGGQVTSIANPTLGVIVCCDYTPSNPPVATAHATQDDLYGTFGDGGGALPGPTHYPLSLSGLSLGLHFVPLFATDAIAGTTTATQSGATGGSSYFIGQPFVFSLLTVNPPSITTATLPDGKEGVAYSQAVAATDGTGGYAFNVSGGTLPDGLAIAAGGTISGTPTLAGPYNFTVAVTDSSGGAGSAPLSITITPGDPVIAPSVTSIPFGTVNIGANANQTVTLKNTGFGSLAISSVLTTGTNAGDFAISSNTCTTLAHSATCSFLVTFTPGAAGGRSGNVSIASSDTVHPTTTITLTGTGLITSFLLTAAADGTGAGVITATGINCPGDCTEPITNGATVVLTATPNASSAFAAWTGCDSVAANKCTVTMSSDRTVTASFTTLTVYNIVLEGFQEVPYVDTPGSGAGTATFNPVTGQLSFDISYAGTTNNETDSHIYGPALRGATADAIIPMSSTITKTDAIHLSPSQQTMLANGQLYVSIATALNPGGELRAQIDNLGATLTRALTAAKTGTGNGIVVASSEAGGIIVCGLLCAANVPDGKVVTFTPHPTSGSRFTGWSGACAGTGACQVTMSAARSVTATFDLSAAPTTTLSSSASIAVLGDTVTLTATMSGASGVPTGNVIFLDGHAPLATVAVDGTGHAVLAISTLAAGAHDLTVMYQGDLSYAAATSAIVTVTILAGTDIPRLGNISTRGQVQTGFDVMIGGFVISGSTAKTVIVRATGPSLANFGVSGALSNPTLQLVRSSDNSVIATNDDWGSAANAADVTASGFAPSNPLESAILATLQPGAYTAIVSGVGGVTGVGLVEVYEVDHPEIPLINISTRGQVQSGFNVMIGGFVIQGSDPETVIIRAIGPSLANFGVSGALANPTMSLVRMSDNATIAVNDDWGSAANAAQITSSGFAPANPLESAILMTLAPGAYTAVVSGVSGGTGVGLVEVYKVGP